MIAFGFFDLKIQLPETKISAPNLDNSFALLRSTPPSICINVFDYLDSIKFFKSLNLKFVSFINF